MAMRHVSWKKLDSGSGYDLVRVQTHSKMTVKPLNISLIVGYTISAIFFVFGLVMLLGITIPTYIPKEFRITIGVVLLLWAIYRFVLTRMKAREEREGEE